MRRLPFAALLSAALLALAAADRVAAGDRCGHAGCACSGCSTQCRCAEPGPAVEQLAEAFKPGGPTSPTGTRAVVDLPAGQHMRNTGGNDRTKQNPRGLPGKGSGLCVFTSVEVLGRWQNLPSLAGLQKFMTTRPGGGWPEKLDKVLAEFYREKGLEVPPYTQHTGGDEKFLELALATGRGVAITYAGEDDFYREPIAHMVNLAHLDSTSAAIIDNNRPGVWVWMTRGELLERWRAMRGGWAFVLLTPPPPPRTSPATSSGGREFESGQWGPSGCGPRSLPMMPLNTPPAFPPQMIAPWLPIAPPAAPVDPGYRWEAFRDRDGERWHRLTRGAEVLGAWWGGGWHPARPGVDVYATDADPAGPPVPPPAGADQVDQAEQFPAGGVVSDKIHAGRRYFVNGAEVTRERCFGSFGADLVDDSNRHHLTIVGGDFLSAGAADRLLAKVPAELRGRLHVQTYPADHWAVELFRLKPGVTLRSPAKGGTAAELMHLPSGSTAEQIADGLHRAFHPTPAPTPTPTPGPVASAGFPWLLLAGVVLAVVLRKRLQ